MIHPQILGDFLYLCLKYRKGRLKDETIRDMLICFFGKSDGEKVFQQMQKNDIPTNKSV